jgi:hypothetical protein
MFRHFLRQAEKRMPASFATKAWRVWTFVTFILLLFPFGASDFACSGNRCVIGLAEFAPS